MSLPAFNHAARISRALLGAFAGVGLVAVSMSLAAQHRTSPLQDNVLTHHAPPETERTGTRARTTAPPARRGSRAAHPPQGKPAPGPDTKPIPDDAGDCRPTLSATRVTGLTRTGARTTAIGAWEASAIAMYGSGFRWESARDQSTECSLEFGWTCTVRARPCRN